MKDAVNNARVGAWWLVVAVVVGSACRASPSGAPSAVPMDSEAPAALDAGPAPDVSPVGDANPTEPRGVPLAASCQSPGEDVAGAVLTPDFCVRRFAKLGTPRTLVFAPNGDLFVGSPSAVTAGGASGGLGQIVILSDDDHDGSAELHVFATNVPDVHGLALGGDFLYFTTTASVWRTPYAAGQRVETVGAREDLGLPGSFFAEGRWTHGLARSPGGQLYLSRGAYGSCGGAPGGEIGRIGAGVIDSVAKGFRNPMYMRCHRTDEICAATELGEDQTPGAKEKLVFLRTGTDYGYPCCFSTAQPASSSAGDACGQVTHEEASFTLADTPFGFDWERQSWPEPFRDGIFVALHGSFYTTPAWSGAGIVYAKTDPITHKPVEGWHPFLGGFGPGGSALERPADVAFADDGRLFFADDQGGAVYWIAPRAAP
jgi:glucose/arabinose dehydrogenase